jgi:hypothetical protein
MQGRPAERRATLPLKSGRHARQTSPYQDTHSRGHGTVALGAPLTARDVCHVCRPGLEAVEDVGGVHDGGAALDALVREEGHQIRSPEDVQIHRDLVQEQDLFEEKLQGGFGVGLGAELRKSWWG